MHPGLLDRRGQVVEAILKRRQTGLPGLGQQQRAVQAPEQLNPQIVLQRLDLMTDCRGRYVQLFGRPGKAQMAGRSLEGAQGIERWQRAG